MHSPIKSEKWELKYRRDIDGLRALAVLIVVGYHAFPALAPGGYVGVDVFFVISGFLITSLILNDLQAGRFTFGHFYSRRIRRIFPALIIVLAVSFTLGWLYLVPLEFLDLGKSIAGGAAFAANIVFYNEAGYFDIEAARKPLLHLWSLGIEEQFYIVWPILLLFFVKRGLNIFYLVSVLAVISLVANIATASKAHPLTAFYLPHARAWELMFGALLACLAAQNTPARMAAWLARTEAWIGNIAIARFGYRSKNALHDLRALFGIALIFAGVAFLHRDSTYPGWRALLPTVGTFLLIWAEPAWFNRHVLSSRVLVFVGLISYPLYLWHWPILAFGRIIGGDEPSTLATASLMGVAFLLACLTYFFLERPIRLGNFVSLKVVSLSGLMAASACLGVIVIRENGFSHRLPEHLRGMFHADVTVDVWKEWRRGTCLLEAFDDRSKFASNCVEQNRRPLLFLWGDSTAAALYPGLRNAQTVHKFGIGQLTIAGCPPSISYVSPERKFCKDNNALALPAIHAAKPDVVILASSWVYPDLDLGDDLRKTIADLRQAGSFRIIVVGPPVTWRGRGPQDYFLRYSNLHDLAPPRTDHFIRWGVRELDDFLRAKAKAWDVEFISQWDAMCNAKGCLTRTGPSGHDIVAFDGIHLTTSGSVFLINALMPRLLVPEVPRLLISSP